MARCGYAAVLLLVAACAAPDRPPPSPPAAPAPAPPPSPRAAPPGPPPTVSDGAARYGPEPRVAPTAIEARANDAVRGRLPGATSSGALALASRDLARLAAAGETSLARDRLRGALARGLSFDAAPAAYQVTAGRDNAAAALSRALPAEARATHFGVGTFEDGERVWLVLLTAERKATLAPFPRDVPAGETAALSGRLAPPLLQPRVFVTSPDGGVREAPVQGGRDFRASVAFPEPGRYLVEVVAQSGPGGPEVAALLTVSAGGAALERAGRAREAEPAALRDAEARVVDLVNAARRARGLAALPPDPAVADVARAHSARMLEARTLAHVLPGSGDLGDRLRRARVPYTRAFENVAMGGSTFAAHEAAEESPAHLANILAAGATHVGVGAARGTGAHGRPVVYLTEVFVERASAAPAPAWRDAPERRVREVVWDERARARRAPLTSDARLDALAREAAAQMRRADEPAGGDLGQRALGLGRRISAVDVFVAGEPSDAARSANVRDGRFRRVGVGVAVGDSPRFGADRLWIAVVFTD